MLQRCATVFFLVLTFLATTPRVHAQQQTTQSTGYLGFDMNLYPGDAMLPALHKTFSYVGYWLNVPPGAQYNPWKGKRAVVAKNGFGFLVLFNGRIDRDFRRLEPVVTGKSDAAKAIAAATAEGFPGKTIIFLDLEEGARMTPKTAKYVAAWVAAIRASKFRPGAYCSGVEVDDDPGTKISTADDIRNQLGEVALWLATDDCPPAPGCTYAPATMQIASSGRADALVWQYAQSPRRPEITKACATTYARDGNCYPPGVPHLAKNAIDLNYSTSPDPSCAK